MDSRKDVARPDPTVESIQPDFCMDSRTDVIRSTFRHMTMMDHDSVPDPSSNPYEKILYGSQEGRGAPRSYCEVDLIWGPTSCA